MAFGGKILVLRLMLPILVLISAGRAAAGEEPGRIKFGVVLALSGPTSGPALACRSGMEFAREDMEPEVRDRLTLLFEDDRNDPKNTISGFKKLVEIEQANVVFSYSSGCSHAVAPLAEKAKIPLLAIASDQKVVDGKRYAMTIWVGPNEEGLATFDEVLKRGYKRIARISAEHEGMIANRDAFDRLNKGQVEFLIDDTYPTDTKDFKPFLLKVKRATQIDAVAVYLYFGQTGVFARQMKQYGLNLPMFNNESFEDSESIADSGGALVGHWFVSADEPEDKLRDRFLARHPGGTTVTLANCYDAAALLGQAIRENKTTPDQINSFLHAVRDFKGATGTISATANNRFTIPAAVKVVTADGFKKIGR